MKRWFAVCISLIFVAGCSGAGGGTNRFLPESASPSFAGAQNAAAGIGLAGGTLGVLPDAHGRRLPVAVTMRIPKRHRRERAMEHPATISALTQSVSFIVNNGTARIFNATTKSSNCTAGATGTTCTFTVGAPAGLDAFLVTTYSGLNGTGTALNRGSAKFNIVKGKTNSPKITLGPLVSTAADSGVGSLRYAVATANSGDTIIFSLPATSAVQLTTPITIGTNVSIAGSGVTSNARPRRNHRGLRSNSTFTGTTISGKGANQVFIIKSGVTATISGLVITDGKASVAAQPGGAISNLGNLTLSGDAITDSTSTANARVRGQARHHALHPRHVHRPKAPQHKHHHHGKPGPWGLRPHTCGTDQYGGALYNDGTLTITGTTFDSNTVSDDWSCSTYGYGGAIYNDTDGSIFSSGSVYTNNGAGDGGAVYNVATNGQISFTGDKFIGNFGCNQNNGCITSGCATAGSCTVYAYGYGSAIQDDDGPGVTITNSFFQSNIAGGPDGEGYGEGGALYLDTGSPLITGSVFTGNIAGDSFSNCGEGYGGAIYEDAGGTVELDKDTFTNNVASGDQNGYGGAVYNDNEPDHGSGNKFTGNQAIGSGSDCEDYPYGEGGALYADYGISMSGSTFTGNIAKAGYEVDGGAIYADEPSTLSGDTFTGNSAIATGITDEDSYAYGGAIEDDDGLKLSNSTFTSNTAQALGIYGYYVEGGVIYAASPLTSTNNVYASNTANATYQDDADVYGGVIYADDTFVSSHDTFKNNAIASVYDVDGGAIFLDSGAANISNDSFTGNTISAPYAYGGAVEHDTSSVATISNSTFTGNVAGTGTQYGQGGATWDDYATTYNGDTFNGNKAVFAGGAIYDDSGDTINNSTFTGNVLTASQPYYGGGALLAYSTTVNNSTFTANSVTTNGIQTGGGAIYNYDGLTMTGSTLSGNKVLGSNPNTGGGAIFDYDDDTTTNSTIANNTSSWDGGAIDEYGSYSLYYTNVTIYGNSATRNGGNIENPYTLWLYNSIVAGGTAGGTGPDVDVSGSGTLTSGDYNLFGKGVQGSGTFTSASHDQIGSTTAALNPVLAVLSNNGGPTQTMADSPSSTRIYHKIPNASGCNGAGITADQRGYAIGTSPCDIGAFDYSASPSAIKVRPSAMHRHAGHPHPKRGHVKRSPFDPPKHAHRHGVTK